MIAVHSPRILLRLVWLARAAAGVGIGQTETLPAEVAADRTGRRIQFAGERNRFVPESPSAVTQIQSAGAETWVAQSWVVRSWVAVAAVAEAAVPVAADSVRWTRKSQLGPQLVF